MATGTRSLPTDSPVPYYQPFERGPMSEGRLSDPGSQEGMYIPPILCESMGNDRATRW